MVPVEAVNVKLSRLCKCWEETLLEEACLGTSHTHAQEGNDEKMRIGQDAFQQAQKHHPNVRRLQTFTEPRWMDFSRELLAPLLDTPGRGKLVRVLLLNSFT